MKLSAWGWSVSFVLGLAANLLRAVVPLVVVPAATLVAFAFPAMAADPLMPQLRPASERPVANVLPWWLNPHNCRDTGEALAQARTIGSRLLYWQILPPTGVRNVGVVGQLWGRTAGHTLSRWVIVAQTSNGLTCPVAAGVILPPWVTELEGQPA